jgi:hypothetical protein
MSAMSRSRVAAALLSFASLSACVAEESEPGTATAAAAGSGRQCFRPGDVNSFSPQGDDVVYLRVGANRWFRAEILGTCPDIDFSQRVAIRSRGTSWVCQGLDAEFIVPGPLGLDRCPITSLRRLTDAEVEAYRARR